MRFLIDISEPKGCAYCPMNYDLMGCTICEDKSKGDPLQKWEEDGRKDERPEGCPLVRLRDSDVAELMVKFQDTVCHGSDTWGYGRWFGEQMSKMGVW